MTQEVPGGFGRSNELPSPFTLYAVEAYNHPPYPTGYVRQDISVQGFSCSSSPYYSTVPGLIPSPEAHDFPGIPE